VNAPAAVLALYDRRAEAFAADATYAFGADPVDECAPRAVVSGRDEAAAALAHDLGDGRVELLACVHGGRDCLLEGRVVNGGPVAAIGAAVRLDSAGAVERVLSFRTQPVEPPPRAVPNEHHGQVVLDGYFERLERADFAGAAACFSPDVLYSHPPYAPGGARVEHRGREALAAGFAARGPRTWRHRIITFLQDGSECLVEGDVEGLGVWLSSFSLDEHGKIARYCSFYAR
jgi:SnoaL-like domain